LLVSGRSKILSVLAGEVIEPPPIWIMRQAGRYLPEYLQTRKLAGSFLELCLTPEFAAEVLFSDILMVPYALGQSVAYEDGRGPVLGPLVDDLGFLDPGGVDSKLVPVFETVRKVRRELAAERALIGFCGAPWTVATYMIAGEGSADQLKARRLALQDPDRMQRLIDILVEASVRYLAKQNEAGADVLKIFDTWAGTLDDDGFERWCIGPTRSIVERLRLDGVSAPIIGFPRGASARLTSYAKGTGVDAVAVDWMTPMIVARDLVPASKALQGNLDPLRLVAGGTALDDGVETILTAMRGRAHIFNLGHGITPDTPIANVEQLVRRVRRGNA
jgi:uroporphyrinogen decarboxylase